MKEQNWDRIFELLKLHETELPSVSRIAIDYHTPFAVLISTLISLRTKDSVTLSSSIRLLDEADTPQKMLSLGKERIAELIYPASFFNVKSERIIRISEILTDRYDSKIPDDQKELLSLPGVGIKTANLVLNLGFGKDAICVDCHVHQIANRMGWIKTDTPEESEKALMKIMPKSYWIPLNEILVVFGQNTCTPVSPKCSICPVAEYCRKVGVTRSR